jgi:hypothetical protein
MPPGADVDAFLQAAAAEGIVGLLHAGVAAATRWRTAGGLAEGLRQGAHRQAALELAHRIELQRVIAETSRRGLDVL